LQASIETESGVSLEGVEVHYGSPEPAQVGAFAFTGGSRIMLAPGQEHNLAHEAWHVVQQRQGRVRPNALVAGRRANVDDGLEAEADRMATRIERHAEVAAGGRIQRRTDGPSAPSGEARPTASKITAARHRDRTVGTDVIQGRWAGLPPERVSDVEADPITMLLHWAQQNVMGLDVIARRGANALTQIRRDAEWAHARSMMTAFLVHTLRDPDEIGLNDLLERVLQQAYAGGWQPDELPGGEHPEDITGGTPEEPVWLDNLDALVFPEIARDDDALFVIAQRLIGRHQEFRQFTNTEPWDWLYYVQQQIEAQKQFRLRQLLQQFEGGDGDTAMFKRKGNTDSGPSSYNGTNGFGYADVVYTRDGQGGIAFAAPKSNTTWKHPEIGHAVDLTDGVDQTKQPKTGLLSSGAFARIPRGDRAQHFSMANRIVGNGFGRNSPTGETWHHIAVEYWMIRVDTQVHAKHGHNGGNILWT
jgi:hypothetical protein